MNKKSLSERDICTKFITPSLVAAGWDLDTQDFRNVAALFADKDFDGDPVRVKDAGEGDDISDTDHEADDTPVTDELYKAA